MNERKVKYDAEHDVLYIFIGQPRYGYEDEVYPGIFLRKDEDSDEVIGVIIMDFTKKSKSIMRSQIPFVVDYDAVSKEFVH